MRKLLSAYYTYRPQVVNTSYYIKIVILSYFFSSEKLLQVTIFVYLYCYISILPNFYILIIYFHNTLYNLA